MLLCDAAGKQIKSYPLSHVFDRMDARSIEIIIILPSLNELVLLDILLHLFPRHHKVVISPISLVVPLWSSGIFSMSRNINS